MIEYSEKQKEELIDLSKVIIQWKKEGQDISKLKVLGYDLRAISYAEGYADAIYSIEKKTKKTYENRSSK